MALAAANVAFPSLRSKAAAACAALAANDEYLKVRPGDPNPWDTRGDILFWFQQDDEALAAYHKVLELKPHFQSYSEYLKLAMVYADQGKFALADTAVQQYAQKTTALSRLYLPVFEAQFQQLRGDPEGALDSYKKAVAQLAGAGQDRAAAEVLGMFSEAAVLAGQSGPALAYARQQKLKGEEPGTVAILQAITGDQAASESSFQQYAASHPWLSQFAIEQRRLQGHKSYTRR